MNRSAQTLLHEGRIAEVPQPLQKLPELRRFLLQKGLSFFGYLIF